LTFISEFNVQLLYLPGLKNVVTNFLSRPFPIPEASGNVAALTAAANPVDFEAMAASKIAAWKRSGCSAVHPSS
jgi:hypothetical protein